MDYLELRELQKKELSSSALAPLPDNFYEEIAKLLEEKKAAALNSCSLDLVKEYENVKKLIRIISQKREEKIVLLALRGDEDVEGLTKEERQLLKDLVSIIKKSRNIIRSAWDETPVQTVKILKPVEQYKGMDNNLYGPFKEGDIKSLPSREAKWLIEAGVAELVL